MGIMVAYRREWAEAVGIPDRHGIRIKPMGFGYLVASALDHQSLAQRFPMFDTVCVCVFLSTLLLPRFLELMPNEKLQLQHTTLGAVDPVWVFLFMFLFFLLFLVLAFPSYSPSQKQELVETVAKSSTQIRPKSVRQVVGPKASSRLIRILKRACPPRPVPAPCAYSNSPYRSAFANHFDEGDQWNVNRYIDR